MPRSWQNNFENASLTVYNTTLQSMRAYMDKQSVKDPFVPKNKNNNTDSTNGNNSSNQRRGGNHQNNSTRSGNNHNGGRGNRNGNQNRNGGNGNNSNCNNSNRIQNTDPCPLPGHGNHTWGQCRANRFNNESTQGNQAHNNNQNQGHRYNTRSQGRQNQGQNHNVQGTNTNQAPVQTNNSNSNPQQGDTHTSQGQSFATLTTLSIQDSPDSFFNHMDDLEIERYDIDKTTKTTSGNVTKIYPPGEDNIDINELYSNDLIPTTLATAKAINEINGRYVFRSLLDHGGSHVMIQRRCLPANCETFQNANMNFKTTAGSFTSAEYVYLATVCLPEFSYTRKVKKVKAYLFDAPEVEYDLIFGRNFLNQVQIDVLSSQLKCKWFDDEIPFHSPHYFMDNEAVRKILEVQPVRIDLQESFHITAAKSTFADINVVCQAQKHLTDEQQQHLLHVLKANAKLFDGSLGCYPNRQFKIELKADAVPYHCERPYPVPVSVRQVFKDELDRQCELGILEKVYESEWGMPMMVIPKKDGSIRTVDDFRELNKWVIRRKYPLPRIQDVYHRRKKYEYMTILDLTACYYTYQLTEESSWYCVLVTPFGKYRRLRLPMGMSQSPDWAQGALEEVLQDLLQHSVECFIDDVAIFTPQSVTDPWTEHMTLLNNVLTRLREHGYQINPQKCQWAVKEAEFLGHWLTPDGIKPLRKKIEGIMALDEPKTLKQLRGFIGMVNFYRDFWKSRAHLMAPLTSLTKIDRKQFAKAWTTKHSQCFQAIKTMIAEDVLLTYPDPNKPFLIQTDASDLQLGAVIYQDNQPIAFFSRKLNDAQRRYPASDKEALCIQEVLHEYRNILYGADITIHTDHQNLIQRDLKSPRLLHWRLLIEEFSPKLVYIKGETNVVADNLSRLPLIPSGRKQETNDSLHSTLEELAESLLYYPKEAPVFPLSFDNIQRHQQNDPVILALEQQGVYTKQEFYGTELICNLQNNQQKIVLPEVLQDPAIQWYHIVMGHGGATRLYNALNQFLFSPKLKARVEGFVATCDACQRNKNQGMRYGHLPPRNDVSIPWEEIAVDLIGPWSIDISLIGTLKLRALTAIDTATGLAELTRIDNRSSAHVAFKFEQMWLARYPRPIRVIHDQGTEFTGANFQLQLHALDIEAVPTTVKNPQANAICERMHKTCGDQIRTLLAEDPPVTVESALDLVDAVLAAAQRALRITINRTIGTTPGAIVFGRDMLLPIPVLTDFNLIRQRRQAVIDDNNRKVNLRRNFHDYRIGEKVLILTYDPTKLEDRAYGPYLITETHVNGTVTIQRATGVLERINIRRVRPYRERNTT